MGTSQMLGEDIDSWETMMFLYNSALKEVGTKLEILNDEFVHIHKYNPIEYIKSRIKTPESIVSQGITLVPEGRRVFADLTVLENLKVGAYLRKDSLDEDIRWCYDLFPRLKERSWQLAGTLSGGEQQMLAIARALMSRPDVIMMDEPSLGLAPIVVRGVFDIIREINRQGKTILLVEQNANMALNAAHHGYVM